MLLTYMAVERWLVEEIHRTLLASESGVAYAK